jgi:hypothetical protein
MQGPGEALLLPHSRDCISMRDGGYGDDDGGGDA